MKTKTAVLNGKLEAGNSHVRFDEGKVASAKPRRGPLFYRTKSLALDAIVAVLTLASVGASATTITCVKTSYSSTPQDATLWSDGLTPDPKNDYLVNAGYLLTTGDAGGGAEITFTGGSLTIGGDKSSGGLAIVGKGGGTGTTTFPCGITVYDATKSTINITAKDAAPYNCRIIKGVMTLLSDYVAAPQFVAQFRSYNQTCEFADKIVGDATTGMAFKPAANAGNNENTNDFVKFTGDLTEFSGTISLNKGTVPQTVILALGSVTFPGSVKLTGGAQSLLCAASVSDVANVATLEMSAGSGLYPELDIAESASGLVKVNSSLSLTAPIHVTVRVLQDPLVCAKPLCRYPILIAPEGITLSKDDFDLTVRGDGPDRASLFSLDVAPDGDGRSTLYVVKENVDSPIRDIVNATWTGASGTSIDVAGNWKEGLPSFTSGETLATFSESGTEATVAGNACFNGFRFTTDGFVLSGSGDEAKVKVYAQGIGVAEGIGATIGVPMEPYGEQSWTIGTGSGSSLNIRAPILDGGHLIGYPIAVSGGTLDVRTSGSTYIGDMTVTAGDVVLAGDEPIGTSGKLTVAPAGGSHFLYAEGNAIVSKDIEIGVSSNEKAQLSCKAEGITVEFKGVVSTLSSLKVALTKNSKVIFSGGVTTGKSFTPANASGAEIVITNKPVTIDGVFQPDCPLFICSTGNKTSNDQGLQFLFSSSALMRFGVDEAFDNHPNLSQTGKGNRLDLNGHSQTFGTFTQMVNPVNHGAGTPNTSVVMNSGDPATLHIIQGKEQVRDGWPYAWIGGNLTGPIDLWKEGAARLAVTNKIDAVGGIKVTAGRFEFFKGASWLNATNIVVSGSTAVFALADHRALNRKVAMSFAEGGLIEIPAGVQVRASAVSVDGTSLAAGVWRHGDAYDATLRQTPAIAGDGTMFVGSSGVMVIVR